jgi:hypothetical protein
LAQVKVRPEGWFIVGGVMRSGSQVTGLLAGQHERGRLLYRGTVEWGLIRQLIRQRIEDLVQSNVLGRRARSHGVECRLRDSKEIDRAQQDRCRFIYSAWARSRRSGVAGVAPGDCPP